MAQTSNALHAALEAELQHERTEAVLIGTDGTRRPATIEVSYTRTVPREVVSIQCAENAAAVEFSGRRFEWRGHLNPERWIESETGSSSSV